jgi:ABC-type multidrug transport system fused ATPase/permease subunit
MSKKEYKKTEPVSEVDNKKITKEGLFKALFIFKYILPYKTYFGIGLIFLILSSLTTMIFPFATGKLVDASLKKNNLFFQEINNITLALILVLVAQATFSFMRIWLFSLVSEKSMSDIRKDLYKKMLTLSIPFFEKRRVGELTSRISSDVSQLQDIISITLAEFLRQIVTLIVGIVIIFITSPKLTLFMLGTFPFLIIIAIVFGKKLRGISKNAQDKLAEANVIVEETFQSISMVKSFVNEWFEIERYNNSLNKVVSNSLRGARLRGAFVSFIILAIFGGIVGVLWYGARLVGAGEMTVGALTSFIIYTTFIGASVGGIGEIYGLLQKTIGASERLREILIEDSEHSTTNKVINTTIESGEISFKNVIFAYPSRPEMLVLKGINFNILKGQKIALVGQSGAGKSTIMNLLLKFYDINAGEIYVNNQNINDIDLSTLRNSIGVVPQDVVLFGGSIKENILYGNAAATEIDILKAAEQANALDFIKSFPQGFDTLVGDRGIKLSGGQKQRIAIARAILKNPKILILDEATSALDNESEVLVQQALENLMKNRTTIIIAHRLSTIRNVDTIFVFNDGIIQEQGSHSELIQIENGFYSNLLQISLV